MTDHVDTPDIEVDPLPTCFHVRTSLDLETHEMKCSTCGQVFVPVSERDDLKKLLPELAYIVELAAIELGEWVGVGNIYQPNETLRAFAQIYECASDAIAGQASIDLIRAGFDEGGK